MLRCVIAVLLVHSLQCVGLPIPILRKHGGSREILRRPHLFQRLTRRPASDNEMSGYVRAETQAQPEPFSENALSTVFTDNRVTVRIDSASLSGSVLSAVGVVKYSEVTVHANISDEADVVGTSGSSAFVMQMEIDGDSLRLRWSKRTCPCADNSRFAVTSMNGGEDIWIAGSTTGLPDGQGGMTEAGMALMRYNSTGDQLMLERRGNAGERYEWIGVVENAENESMEIGLLATSNAQRFEGLEEVLFAQVVNETGSTVRETLVTDEENAVSEIFWSADSFGKNLYAVGRRKLQVNWTTNFEPTISKVDLKEMKVIGISKMEYELQRTTGVCAESDNVTTSYVARTNNQGRLIVQSMDTDLKIRNETELRIQRDLDYPKAVKSSVAGCDASKAVPAILMNTAEALNQSAPDWDVKRRLTNVRPAVVAVEDGEFSGISQSQRSTEWIASGLIGSNPWIVYGREGHKPLVASVSMRISEKVTITPQPTASATPVAECIGVETILGGQTAVEHVLQDERMRMQTHPLSRRVRRKVLCRTAEADVICATAKHVVLADGRMMFMEELCEVRGDCYESLQHVMNFKAECGVMLPAAADGVQLSMHAAVGDEALGAAIRVVERECALRHGGMLHRAWWWLRTL